MTSKKSVPVYKIRDKDINSSNYASYKKASVSKSGTAVFFTLAGGKVYDVPVDYIVTWYKEPSRVYVEGKWKDYDGSGDNGLNVKKRVAFKCRRVVKNTVVRVYLNNLLAYDVPWDTLLMACEEAYEHFGGLTVASKKTVSDYHSRK